jgi:hypothetical protein
MQLLLLRLLVPLHYECSVYVCAAVAMAAIIWGQKSKRGRQDGLGGKISRQKLNSEKYTKSM